MSDPIIKLDDIAEHAAMAAGVGDVTDCKYPEGTYMHDLWMIAFDAAKNVEDEND